jgi:hypothetical protein
VTLARGQDMLMQGQDYLTRGQDYLTRGQDYLIREQSDIIKGQDNLTQMVQTVRLFDHRISIILPSKFWQSFSLRRRSQTPPMNIRRSIPAILVLERKF